MNVKRFTARSSREALRLVRDGFTCIQYSHAFAGGAALLMSKAIRISESPREKFWLAAVTDEPLTRSRSKQSCHLFLA